MAKKSFFKQSANVSASSTTTTLEVNKPTKFLKADAVNVSRNLKSSEWNKWFLISGLTVCVSLILVAAGITYWYVKRFEQTSGANVKNILTAYWESRETLPLVKNDQVSFLLLGIDQSTNQRETSLLTDTMILARLNQSSHSFTLYSLPRDLWIDSLKTKINALYYYGQQDGEIGGINLVNSVINEIAGFDPNYFIIINMDSLKQVIDALGGVDVEIERPFEDRLYPREIDLTSTDMSVLYETVTFKAGVERMNGDRALKYIRSRHSEDEFEGTDAGRERRQQRLLTALKQKLIQPQTMTDPYIIGKLYKVWKESFQSNLNDSELIQLTRALATNSPSFVSKTLPIHDASHSGLIYHPPVGPANQWVYLPVDTTWTEIRKWFNQ